MPFFKWSEMKSDFITPGYSSARGANIRGEVIEVGRFFYPAGTQAKPHSHPNEQVQVMLSGRIKSIVAGEERILGPGEAVLIPAETEHSLEVLEDTEVINCKNTVQGWSVHDARWEK